MTETHYETFFKSRSKYRPLAKECLEAFKKCMPETPERWFMSLFTAHGREIPAELKPLKKYIELEDSGNLRLDAFLFEYICFRIEATAENNTFSLGRLRATDYAYVQHAAALAELGIPSEMLQTSSELAFQILNHEKCGKKVYEVSPGLADKLKHTELRGLLCEDIRMPYNNVYITIPENVGFKVYNDLTGWHNVKGIYITEDKDARREPGVANRYRADPKTRTVSHVDGVPFEQREQIREWAMMIVGGPGTDKDGKEIPNDDALFFFRMYFKDGTTLESAINEVELRNKKDKDVRLAHLWENMESVWKDIFRWSMNVIMYATYSNPGESFIANKEARDLWARIKKCPSPKKKQSLLTKAKRINKQERILLGKSITIDRSQERSTATGDSVQKTTVIRVKVSGHWRNVRCGKNNSERRWKFIEPFWRGPDLGETISNRHLLK